MKHLELLEAAAKSINLTLRYDYLGGRDANQPWDPIEDNGDAMALAIERNLQVDPGSDERGFAVVRTPGDNWKEFREPHGDDKEAAVRLAITHAAGATSENEASGIRIYDLEPDEELWDADTKCDHDIRPQPGGGIKCTKCAGWFCF